MNNENARILLARNDELEDRLANKSFFIKKLQADLKGSEHANAQYAENYQSMVSERNDMVVHTGELLQQVNDLSIARNDTVVRTQELSQQVRDLEEQVTISDTIYNDLLDTRNDLLAGKKKLVRELEIRKSTNRLISDRLDKAHATAARQCTNILELSDDVEDYKQRLDEIARSNNFLEQRKRELESILEVSKKEQV
ncbi:MAG: hypothetical protein PF440_01420, partial [Thiomicrorhabdus sp.]|nr:hypothetical protein [Thiomicrorhabdus sp.]